MAQGRSSLIIVPREHGAWAMLCIPYLAGAASVRLWFNFGLFAAAGSVLFLFLMFIHGLWQLPLFGAAGTALFLIHIWFVARRRERSVGGELTGIAMLTMTAPLALYLTSEELLTRNGGVLWFLNALYFGASVFYVKMKLKASARRGKPLLFGGKFSLGKSCIEYALVMVVTVAIMSYFGLTPALTLLAFAPSALYILWGVLTMRPPPQIRAEGFIQACLSLIFVAIVVFSYKVG